jgi:hypothetical protein
VSAAEQARKAEAASAQLRSAEERLADVNAQVARAQQQLSDLQEQIAAARQQQLSVASNTHLTNAHVQHHQQAPAGVLHTPGSGSGLLLLQHGGLSPPPHEHRGLRGSMQGRQLANAQCLLSMLDMNVCLSLCHPRHIHTCVMRMLCRVRQPGSCVPAAGPGGAAPAGSVPGREQAAQR